MEPNETNVETTTEEFLNNNEQSCADECCCTNDKCYCTDTEDDSKDIGESPEDSSMYHWAEREVDIAMNESDIDKDDPSNGYFNECYKSALKAFKSLLSDEHSGYSIGITKNILNRLIDGNPLTPITDVEDNWNHITTENDGTQIFQCKRMSSLFKRVKDNIIKYNDINRFVCASVYRPNTTYTNGFISKALHKIYPITMPYSGGRTYRVTTNECLTDKKNGDFDTIAILTVKKPDGEIDTINLYFKESDNTFVEIDESEYLDREANRVDIPIEE